MKVKLVRPSGISTISWSLDATSPTVTEGHLDVLAWQAFLPTVNPGGRPLSPI